MKNVVMIRPGQSDGLTRCIRGVGRFIDLGPWMKLQGKHHGFTHGLPGLAMSK